MKNSTKRSASMVNTAKSESEQLADLLVDHDYQEAIEAIRDLLRRHLVRNLGKDWQEIRNVHGMYTILSRPKGKDRTIQKFDRLLADGKPITKKNFYQYMPDLVGGRLVILDPDDLFKVAELVRARCVAPVFLDPQPQFTPRRVRHARLSMYEAERFREAGYEVEVEPTGYCSIHFVYKLGEKFFDEWCGDAHNDLTNHVRNLANKGCIPLNSWYVEVQVRTILDEGWGEISHLVQYEDKALKDDEDLSAQFAALSSYLQAANHHVTLIRKAARRKKLLINGKAIP